MSVQKSVIKCHLRFESPEELCLPKIKEIFLNNNKAEITISFSHKFGLDPLITAFIELFNKNIEVFHLERFQLPAAYRIKLRMNTFILFRTP